ncbi:MAG TPA: peptidylprolyl isomerase [Nannocystaceae bacterium]|nr:peptidylprolyl isomerase [Nannocystaceae bacterium]
MRAVLRALVREPLVHFAILGGALFGLDGAVSRGDDAVPAASRQPFAVPTDPIVVDDTVRATLAEQWARTHPTAPDDEQLERLVQRWIDDEVLYREGLARGLADGDAEVRARVASQMAYVLQSRIAIAEPDDAELRAWFEAHADRWAEAERVDFTQVFVDGTDDAAEAKARELLRLLEGGADPAGLGDTFAGGRRFRGRRIAELAERFGEAFTTGMATQSEGTWALRRSPAGLHLVRIERRTSARAPDFESQRDAVRHAWEEERRASAMDEAKRELRGRWEIVVAP